MDKGQAKKSITLQTSGEFVGNGIKRNLNDNFFPGELHLTVKFVSGTSNAMAHFLDNVHLPFI